MPRPRQGVFVPPLPLDRVRRADLYRHLRDAIIEGTLPAASRLPSTRELAAEHGLSRTTVEEIYGQLESEGFLARVMGRGSFVADALLPVREHGASAPRRARLAASRRGVRLAANARCREPESLRAFNAGVPDLAHFPWRAWERASQRALRDSRAQFNRSDPRGLAPLRAAIARHLAQFRGVRATGDQVVIFSSSQLALLALALLLLDPGDEAWMEEPGYHGAHAAFDIAGAKTVPVPVDAEGLVVDAGRRRAPRARLCYCTPAHQYPTGAVLAPERRAQLLAWAEEADAFIVEDDYDGDFRHVGQPLTALQALDGGARIAYVGTLSKAMFMGLRVAYAVVPETLVEPLANLRTQLDCFPAAPVQLALARFLDDGDLASHVRRMRAVYAEKRARLVAGLAPLADAGWEIGPNAVGMHLAMLEPAPGEARRAASASELALVALSDYALAPLARDGVMLRYGGLPLAEIEAGVATLRAECGARLRASA